MVTATAAIADMLIDAAWRGEAVVRQRNQRAGLSQRRFRLCHHHTDSAHLLLQDCGNLMGCRLTGPYSDDLQQSAELVPLSLGVLGATLRTCTDVLVIRSQLCCAHCALSTVDGDIGADEAV